MSRFRRIGAATAPAILFAAVFSLLGSGAARAGELGTYEPNNGFKLADTDRGDLNVRIYTYVRYLNSKGLDPTFTDSFGTTTTLDRRQDIQFQKVTVYFQGWLMSRQLRYSTYVWTSNTSQGLGAQVIVGGNLNYVFNKYVTAGAGIDALPGVRATEGNFPFWLTEDNRLMADEFFRPSYTMGIWARGKLIDSLTYRAMLGNNLSQLGVDAGELDDGLNTLALALIWHPTTGEFGLRDNFGDFEMHDEVATRIAAHFTRSDESRQGQPNTDAFENVTIRLSDGNPIFKPNLFGPGIQIFNATYHMFCADGGVKYRGFSLDGEYYWRWVNELRGPGTETLAFDQLEDNGFQLQGSGMIVAQTLQGYSGVSKIFGEFGDPWDLRFGLNWHPWHNHVVRWNFEYLYTDRSPIGGSSLPTLVGGTGDIFHTSFRLNF